jgi:hypothetical protein
VPRNLALLAVSCLVALLGAEVAARVLWPQLGWRLFPDVGLGWSSREYQDFEPSTMPRDGERLRVLFLGDSHLAGAGNTSLEKRFPSMLRERLPRQLEVQILAAGGWGTDQQLLAFLQKGRQWQPDLVILVFCATNDLANVLSNTHVDKTKPYFVLSDDELALYTGEGVPAGLGAQRAQSPARFQSYLLDLLRLTLRPAAGPADAAAVPDADFARVDPRYLRFDPMQEKVPEITYGDGSPLSWSPQLGVNRVNAYIHEDFEVNAYQWALFERLLGELERAVRGSGAELVVMLLPVSLRPMDLRFIVGSRFERIFDTPDGRFTFRADEPRDRLEAITQQQGLGLFDPTRDWVRLVAERGLIEAAWEHPGDPHLSDTGHEVLAELLQRWMAGRLVSRGGGS